MVGRNINNNKRLLIKKISESNIQNLTYNEI